MISVFKTSVSNASDIKTLKPLLDTPAAARQSGCRTDSLLPQVCHLWFR